MTGPQMSTPEQWPAPAAPPWDPTYSQYTQYAQPPAPRRLPLSKAAIASFVLGLIGGTGLSLVLGLVGLSATGNGKRRGRGFAWAGIALSLVWIAAIIAIVAVRQSHQADRNTDGTVKKAGTSDILSLQKGDCLQDPTAAAAFSQVDVVTCTQAHDSQIYDVVSLTDGSFDRTRIKAEIEKDCTAAASTAIDVTGGGAGYTIGYFYPDPDSWQGGLRTGVCMVTSPTPLTRSVVKTG